MERVIVAEDAPGLAHMLGDLVRGNLATHPDRVKVLESMRGRVNVHATDAEVEVGMVFTGGEVSVGSPVEDADVSIRCDSETLLELTSVPLLMGRPDITTPEGRSVVTKVLKRALVIDGLIRHQMLVTRLQQLLSVR